MIHLVQQIIYMEDVVKKATLTVINIICGCVIKFLKGLPTHAKYLTHRKFV